MSEIKDPYYCLSCNHKGECNGIICITTPCERCGSLLIVPLSAMHLLDLQSLSEGLPALLPEGKQWRGKGHLRLVPPEYQQEETKKEEK